MSSNWMTAFQKRRTLVEAHGMEAPPAGSGWMSAHQAEGVIVKFLVVLALVTAFASSAFADECRCGVRKSVCDEQGNCVHFCNPCSSRLSPDLPDATPIGAAARNSEQGGQAGGQEEVCTNDSMTTEPEQITAAYHQD